MIAGVSPSRFLRAGRLLRWLPPVALGAGAALAALAVGACISDAPTGLHREIDEGPEAGAGGGIIGFQDSGCQVDTPDSGTLDPHAVIGADPSHGPFNGGQDVIIHGRGFTSAAQVWFGSVLVGAGTTVPIDPTSVQVTVPAGMAGTVDLSVQDGSDASTKRTLAGGYTYDAFYAVPNSGPVPGGTVIEIVGQGTSWNAATVAKIDNVACTTLTVRSPTLLDCTVPKGTPGSKSMSVTTGKDDSLILDAYTYADSDNGYKGGLSGGPLAGQLTVLAYDDYTGNAIGGAYVVVGSQIAGSIQGQTDSTGVCVIDDPSLDSPQTVTVAAKCYSPITFIADPVDTATVYLDPVLTPACASAGDPPPVGGIPEDLGQIQGEIVWPSINEFEKGPWSNVPLPLNAHERQAAFVFVSSTDPTTAFQLPSDADAILPTTPGGFGYQFVLNSYAGDQTIYALAGIENTVDVPEKFTAYAMGIASGVSVLPTVVTSSIYVPMNILLDQDFIMNVTPPAPGPAGPDRLDATVAIMLGNSAFAILPNGEQNPLLPVQGNLQFIGIPPLDGALAGSTYWTTVQAVTGPTSQAPMSVVGSILSTSTAQVVDVNDFISVPQLTTPAPGTAWDGQHLAVTYPFGGGPIDLTVYDVEAGNGLAYWTIVVPQGSSSVEVPDLSGFDQASLPPGPLTIQVTGGRAAGFSYGQLLYRQLYPEGLTAYAINYFSAHM
jgi:hypothetical protein